MLPHSVKKRDGNVVKFDPKRILAAIDKAFEAAGENSDKSKIVLEKVLAKLDGIRAPDVESIQDLVENSLMELGFTEVAKAYIVYREEHSKLRGIKNAFEDAFKTVDEYLLREDWRVRENSNMDYSLQGLNNHISTSIISRYWLEKLYPKKIRDAHTDGNFHIHDLGMLSVYCCGWELGDLLESGFMGVVGKVQSGPPKHLRTAMGQIVNYFYTMQGESAGAQAFSNFDTYLAPFIRQDSLSYKDVKQAMQEFVFNVNVPTRVGFQTPFTNITMDLTPSPLLANDPIIIGGERQKDVYGDFQKEMDMLNTAFCEVMSNGDAKGRVFTFPIPTYNITKEFEWDSEVSGKIFDMTSKYGIPYFSNFINSDMKPEDARSMCCRLRLDNRELYKKGGSFFGANPLTGSVGVVTINLPRIGFQSKSENQYFERLDALLELSKESLEIKRRVLEKLTEGGLYPYAKFYLRSINKARGAYWANHFSTIGILGMNESLINFLGGNIASVDGQKFALKVMDYMRKRIIEFQEETGNIYNLEATPGEGTAYRFAKHDRKLYPEIVVANQGVSKKGAAPFYTNSTHLPVNYTQDVFEALDHQDAFQTRYTGGTVFHAFLGERLYDPENTGKLVKKIAENYKLPYYTLTPTFSICPKHGYLNGEHEFCNICDREIGYIPIKT